MQQSRRSGRRFRLPFLSGSLLFDSHDTGGAFSACKMHLYPNSGPEPHIHVGEDELFVVIEGTYSVQIGPDVHHVGPGSVLFVPRGTPHGLKALSEGGRHVTIFVPGGPEDFFLEMDRALSTEGELAREQYLALLGRYGMVPVQGEASASSSVAMTD